MDGHRLSHYQVPVTTGKDRRMKKQSAVYWIRPCRKCGIKINPNIDGFSISSAGLFCISCTFKETIKNMEKLISYSEIMNNPLN